METYIQNNTVGAQKAVFRLEKTDAEFKASICKAKLDNTDLPRSERRTLYKKLNQLAHPASREQPFIRYNLVGTHGRCTGVGGLVLLFLEGSLDACLLFWRDGGDCPPRLVDILEAKDKVFGGVDEKFVATLYPGVPRHVFHAHARWFIKGLSDPEHLFDFVIMIKDLIIEKVDSHDGELRTYADKGPSSTYRNDLWECVIFRLRVLFNRLGHPELSQRKYRRFAADVRLAQQKFAEFFLAAEGEQ